MHRSRHPQTQVDFGDLVMTSRYDLPHVGCLNLTQVIYYQAYGAGDEIVRRRRTMLKWLCWEDALARRAFERRSSLWIASALTRVAPSKMERVTRLELATSTLARVKK
jgi:hypothetical protein